MVTISYSRFSLYLRLCILSKRGFASGSDGKESACNVGNLGSLPGLGRSPGEGNGNPLQYSGRESPMDCIVHGVAEGRRGSEGTERLSLSLLFK